MSSFAKTPSFKPVLPVDSPIYEFSMMVITVGQNYDATMLGTCVVLCNPIVLTARHVAEAILAKFKGSMGDRGYVIDGEVWVVKIVGGDDKCAIWTVESVSICPYTDIAFMHLRPYDESAGKCREWKQPILDLPPPAIGSRVVGFGFNEAKTTVTTGADGTRHIDVQSVPSVTVGQVVDIFPHGATAPRKFPCYQADFYNGHTMSGGAVFNDDGHLCGLISSGMDLGEEAFRSNDHTSFICSLWPMLGTTVHFNRGKGYPRDIPYPALELARDGLIKANGWERVRVDGDTVRFL